MKKIIILLLVTPYFISTMQQVGASQAARILPLIAPQLTPAMRQYHQNDLSFSNKLIIKKYNATTEEMTKKTLTNKYPKIKYIPPIYSSTTFEHSAIKFPSLSPLKKPIIMYNPSSFANEKELEFILLHELGHANIDFLAKLSLYVKYGIKLSFLIGIFFKMIAIKYGLIGYVLAPRLFWTLYLRFFEEPNADDFAIKHANKDVLRGGKQFFQTEVDKLNKIHPFANVLHALNDTEHPTLQNRINKIQRAIDGHPNYGKIIRIGILFMVVEKAIELAYQYSTNEASIKDGIEKIEYIKKHFEEYCDKFEIPAEGRPIYKHALEIIQSYFLQKLYLLELRKTDVKDEEVIETITEQPAEIIIQEKPIIVEEK